MALVPDTGFRLRFPEFAAVEDARVQVFLDDAVSELALGSWPAAHYRRAVNLYTAHALYLSQAQAAGAGAASGPVASKSVDGVSISFAVSAGDGTGWSDWLRSTSYGQELLRLIHLLGPTLLVV